MSGWDDKLLEDETVLFETDKHWAAPLWDSWTAILMILGAFVVAWLQTDQVTGLMGFVNRVLELLQIGLFLGGIALIVYNVINWRTAAYAVTNMRVLGHEGLVRTRATDTLLTSLADVRVKIPAVGKMLGFGDITITSSSGDAGQDTFSTVRRVDEFKKTIFQQKTGDAAKTAGTSPVASGPGSPSATKTLAELAKLRDSGAITPAEYEAKKAELLARI